VFSAIFEVKPPSMNKEDLEKQYAELSTNELLEIVDRKFDYTELAVTVALAEISKREISEETLKEYKDLQVSKAKESIRKIIIDDLKVGYKIFFFFIWIPLLNFPFKQNYRDGDFVLKLSQARYYSGLGFLFMMLTGLLSAFYDLSNLTALTIWFTSFLPAFAFDEFFNRKRLIQSLLARYGKNTN
jgi:hypothetical protein